MSYEYFDCTQFITFNYKGNADTIIDRIFKNSDYTEIRSVKKCYFKDYFKKIFF